MKCNRANTVLTLVISTDSLYIAVDLGAGSGRVFLGGIAPGKLLLEEVRRFHYPATSSSGNLRWDLPKIFDEIKAGAREAGKHARRMGRPIESIGIDGWGVDYGLIDAAGELLEHPICYRDKRTQGVMEKVSARVPHEEIFERTGIQLLVFNTLFQLFIHTQAGMPDTAERLLLIPDLINFFLTRRAVTERTNASTTQLVNASTGMWDSELIERLGLPSNLFTEIVSAGTDLGPLHCALAESLSLEGVRVVAPATHDTASAVVGTTLQDGWAYISSGTWSLAGIERQRPLINREVAHHNFTNEGGAFGTVRFLKNVMGLWIFESCRREWKERNVVTDYDRLLPQVEAIGDCAGLIFPDDPRFLNPPSMLEAVAEQFAESGQDLPTGAPELTKVIFDSLAFRYASVLRIIESLTDRKIKGIQIVGGGSQNDYLNQVTATVTGLPVLAGPVEATVLGNVLMQAIAAGRFASMAEARRYAAETVRLREFAPRPSPIWEQAARRYAAIEACYLN